MSIRESVPAGAWMQIGAGPAIVQLISPDAAGTEVMVLCSATEPTGNTTDGIVMSAENAVVKFSLAEPIWANTITGGPAQMAVQPDVAG